MGILRSDRVSGLGGANAINGSAFFPQNSYINVEPHSDLDLSGDFTIEMWVRNLAGPNIDVYQRQISSKGYYTSGSDGNWYFGLNEFSTGELYFYSYDGQGSGESLAGNIATPDLDRWYHIAAARSGSTLKMFLDGSEEASGTVSKGLDDGGNNGLFIGGISKNTGTDSYGDHYGWISNLRIIKGRALYTSDFTVPTGRLEKTSDTVLLCFQSPGDVLEEKTDKILSHNNHDTTGASKEVSADRLAPDVGEDHGTTFADNTKFDTFSYMVPPGGKTTDRYLKSTGDIVSGNLIWHIDAGNTTSYAGVTTSGTTIYDLKAGSGMNGTVGIATLMSGHSSFPAPGWTPDNGGAWYLASDTDNVPNNVGQKIDMPYVNLGNDNYTINVWAKLQFYSEQSDGLSYLVSNKDGSPVSYHAHIKEVSGQGRIGAGAYYSGWNYDYASSDSENTMIALNKWYMLTWVNTAQYTQSMYVNGVIQKLNGGANTWNSRTSNNTPLNSTAYAGNETTNGWIGQIQYYSDTLTAAEILQNYNAHKCRYDQ